MCSKIRTRSYPKSSTAHTPHSETNEIHRRHHPHSRSLENPLLTGGTVVYHLVFLRATVELVELVVDAESGSDDAIKVFGRSVVS